MVAMPFLIALIWLVLALEIGEVCTEVIETSFSSSNRNDDFSPLRELSGSHLLMSASLVIL